jgi:hypothetical protein
VGRAAVTTQAARDRAPGSHKHPRSSSGKIAEGFGGLALLAGGSATLLELRRRRAFYKADREGRVVLVGPPPLSMAPTAAHEADSSDRTLGASERTYGSIVVKLLGWLDITGARRRDIAGPLQEIIVFLVLNPGRSFTSVQLRESIWCLGRSPLSSGAFRNYMVGLRRAFGPGVVVTDKYRYELTGAVTSDWAMFKAVAASNPVSGPEEALQLIRGPVLHGCFDGKKNSELPPKTWRLND